MQWRERSIQELRKVEAVRHPRTGELIIAPTKLATVPVHSGYTPDFMAPIRKLLERYRESKATARRYGRMTAVLKSAQKPRIEANHS